MMRIGRRVFFSKQAGPGGYKPRRKGLYWERGQSLIEVALLTPLLAGLLLGVIEIGRYAYISVLVGNAAHAGALYAAQGLAYAYYPPGITAAAKSDYQNNGQNPSTLTVSAPIYACGCESQGVMTPSACSTSASPTAGICATGQDWVETVSVTASGTYKALFNYPWIPSSITVSATSTMNVALY